MDITPAAPNDSKRQPLVFVSFASPERQVAKDLAAGLEQAGIPAFFAPRDIDSGMNFALEIVKAISACQAVVVLLSPAAVNSPHVRREVSLAIDERRMLVPLTMPGTVYPAGFTPEWTYWFSAVQVSEYQGPGAVVERVRGLLGPYIDAAQLRTRSDRLKPAPSSRAVIPRRRVLQRKGTPSTLLRAERAIIPIAGRDQELARLEQWCAREDDFDARVVTGRAGEGKTRLAQELASRLRISGWDTTFLLPGSPGNSAAKNLGERPHLIVVDYAETRADQIGDLLDGLLEFGIHDKVRALMLARSATDWWRGLSARSADISELLAGVSVQALAPLTVDRTFVDRLYAKACSEFSAELGVQGPAVTSVPYKEYGSILDVLEDALAAVLNGQPQDGGLGTDRLLSHERRYIAASASVDGIQEIDSVDLNRMAEILSLFGAASEDEACRLIGECNADITAAMRRRIARMFRRLYPGSNLYIEGLKPDALAEELIAEVLADEGQLPGFGDNGWGAARTDEQRRHALTMLARAGIRHPKARAQLDAVVRMGDPETLIGAIQVATQVEEPASIADAIARAVEERADINVSLLLASIPDETVAMADLAAQLARRAVAVLPDPALMSLDEVQLAMECSNRFSDAGWGTEAAESASLAVDRLSVLVPQGIGDRRVLGRALSNLSNRLWELGQIADSLEPARRAVSELQAAGAALADLAAARNNLAFRLTELGLDSDALAEAKEAERISHEPEALSGAMSSRIAGSALNNLTCIYLAMGAPEEALRYGRSAVAMRRSQAVISRDRYLPYVARALANAAPAAAACGEHELADQMISEARSLHSITGQRAPIFRFEEAESATLHAIIFLTRGLYAQAKEAAQEGQHYLSSVSIDLSDLSRRLHATLVKIIALAGEGDCALGDLLRLPAVRRNDIYVPQLLEYRDL
jgi:tetratricopeptide (TPR) repeat protein